MKIYISFFFAGIALISASAIPAERSSNHSKKEFEEQTEIQKRKENGNDNIEDELISILNSPYSEIKLFRALQEFRNEISEMDSNETLWLTKNLEFILGDGDIFLTYDGDYNYTHDYGPIFSGFNYDENYYDSDYDNDKWEVYLDNSYDAVQWALNTVENKANDLFHHLRTKLWKNLKNDDFDELAPMTITERLRIQDDGNMRLNEAIFAIILLSILLFVMLLIFAITIWCMRKKENLCEETKPILSSKPTIKIENISSLKTTASMQDI